MIRTTTSQPAVNSDGTSQEDRRLQALQPDYVEVEGRSLEDLIGEAQRLAKEIQFFDETDQAVSNWENLFIDDSVAYQAKSETGKAFHRKRWAVQLAAYVDNPELFQNSPQVLSRLSRPHVVLFMTFLKLLNQVKSQVNGLTRKHLDFYFLERLGFTPREAVPDVVNVLLELANDVSQLEVKKGTLLYAGDDEDGNELLYKTDRDAVISDAQITALKTVFVEKATITIKDTHLQNLDLPDKGFQKMMEMALGSPEPGDELPQLPAGLDDLLAVYNQLEAGEQAAKDYVGNQLSFPSKDDYKDFRFVLETHQQDLDPTVIVLPETWEEVYRLLDQAFKNRHRMAGQARLKEIHEGKGFDALLKHVYGSPEPGDALPLYRGELATISSIFADLSALQGVDEAAATAEQKASRQAAQEYLLEEFVLTEKDFVQLAQTLENPNASPEDWEQIYKTLELANRKVRSLQLPSPMRKELFNVFAQGDAPNTSFSMHGEEEESVRFKTFGGPRPDQDDPLDPAYLGFAISSPLLLLEEGKRTIHALISLDGDSVDAEKMDELFNSDDRESPVLDVFISTEEKWIRAREPEFSFSHHTLRGDEGRYTAVLSGQVVSKSAGEDFVQGDLGKYLVWSDGNIYQISSVLSREDVEVKKVGEMDGNGRIRKYAPSALYLNGLMVKIELQEEDAPIAPVSTDEPNQLIYPEFPALVFSLRHSASDEEGSSRYRSEYQHLIDLKMEKVFLTVQAQGMRNLVLQNDLTNLDRKKPFEPWGFQPEVGSSFYLSHPELCRKRLDHLYIDLEWMKASENFRDHYRNYWLIEEDNPNLSLGEFTVQSKEDFKAKAFLCDSRAELPLGSHELFSDRGDIRLIDIPGRIEDTDPNFRYLGQSAYRMDEDVLDCDRYFKLELGPLDFQHATFNGLFRKQALSENPAIGRLSLNPPYTPKLKSIKAGYSAHTEIVLSSDAANGEDGIYHLHPFGYSRVRGGETSPLLPQYRDEGTLYLGIENLAVPQTLSMLFQMSEGSANPDLAKPEVSWSCLSGNEWLELGAAAVLSDTTNGLLNTGIVQVAIPKEASKANTLLPGEMSWLRVTCAQDTAAISDTIQIATQALSATLSSEKVAKSHFVNLLAADSVAEPKEFTPEISKIAQPYTSSKGKPAEKDAAFYNRISERIRHKNRAITMWDYERLVLDQFPEVYKAKCLPASQEQVNLNPGMVNLLVVPDIKGKLPFNPFEPKLPAGTLHQIKQFLDAHAPAYADIQVNSPHFSQIMVRCVVKFKEGYNEGFYKPKLIDELKRFLAPWAYPEGGKITIGGSIHASVIVNFIAERPYITYVANMKLFQSDDGKQFIDVRALNPGKSNVVFIKPDTVLVSAPNHEIDIVDENGYDEDNFEGINYMKVELDFQVGENLLS